MSKYVIIAAPHTSNWDLVIALLVAYYFRLDMNWLGKHTLFHWPFGILFRWVGGIPIDRRARSNAVEQVILTFRSRDRMALLITPEGSRKKTDHWKTGFYHIALGAQVPIVLGFVDFRNRTTGLGPTFKPSGDIEADMRIIQEFFAPMRGKRPELKGDIRLRNTDRTG